MYYGVISDSHDNFDNLNYAINVLKERKILTCFHLGDFCAPTIVSTMLNDNKITWICVWGNVDGAKVKIMQDHCGNERFNIVSESFREFETPEGKVFLTHYPLLARIAAKSGMYIAAFYGHTHIKHIEYINGALLANPGEIVGFKTKKPTFGIWNSKTNKIEVIPIKPN